MSDDQERQAPVASPPAAAAEEAGYGKPPKSGRFRKGVSGNPLGRPKGSRNIKSLIREMLDTQIETSTNGGAPEKKSVCEAMITKLAEKALGGHYPSMSKLLGYAEKYEEEDEIVDRVSPYDFEKGDSGLTLEEECEAILSQRFTDGRLWMTSPELGVFTERYSGTDTYRRWMADAWETDDPCAEENAPAADEASDPV
ncbi:MAG: DUF5681 domain-containing protein [Pseudomonadota bacterium]